MIKQSALVLIEFQREWLDEDGKINPLMQDRKQFQVAIAAAKQALEAARQAGMPIVHCGLKFQPGHPELGQAQYGLREAIARFGTFSVEEKGSQFVEPFVPQAGEFVVQGRTGGSGFAGSNLDSYLRNQGITKIYLAGFALHVCVESTLRHGHDLGYTTIVLEDACAAFNQAQRQHVLEDVVHHFGERMTVDQFITQISSVT
ncbi:MAG: cysteine hydrolase [Leptolyngbyaceae cyanobacterium bins.302]|nr:cysteine hydrolase [Leptolyngbyaceae cyanobacterium bins.302]